MEDNIAKASLKYTGTNVLDGMAQEFGRSRETIRMWLMELSQRGIVVQRPYSNQRGEMAPGATIPLKSVAGNSQSSYVSNGESAEYVITTEKRIVTEQDIIDLIKLDTKEWRIERFLVGTSEGYRKDRSVHWDVVDGKVTNGKVRDSGKMLVVPVHTVRIWCVRKTQEIRNGLAVEDLKKDLARISPRVHRIKYPKITDGMLYEIEMPDNHIGKLTWHEESGEDSDLKTQTARVLATIDQLLAYAKSFPVERILLPVGNDWFNTDSKDDTTTGGTKQQEDTRWQKTYRAGRQLAVEIIDRCAVIAPVDVIIIPGNHDEQKTFYLGDGLQCWYHNNQNVNVDNSAKSRKFYLYGNSLIGFAHGSNEKTHNLSSLMAGEVPDLWAKSKFREWHLGHWHHKEDTFHKLNEDNFIVVRVLRSLSPPDAWHYKNGFIGAQKASEGFLWTKDGGVVGQFTVTAKPFEG